MAGLPGVDEVFVVRAGRYDAARGSGLVQELSRIGIDRFQSVWVPDSPFDVNYAQALRFNGCGQNLSTFRCMLGHYRAMAVARELGFRRVLILEDDVRFLKDVAMLRSALADVPDDFRFAKLAWALKGGATREEVLARPRKGVWLTADGLDVRDATACLWSAAGLTWWTGLVEASVHGRAFARAEMRSADTYQMSGFYAADDGRSFGYLSVPMLAVSQGYPCRMTASATKAGQIMARGWAAPADMATAYSW